MDKKYQRPDAFVERMLLQQHRSLLLQEIVSRVSYRIIDCVILSLAFVALISSTKSVYASVALTLAAYFVAGIWFAEHRRIDRHLAVIEKAIAQKNATQFDESFVRYNFAIFSETSHRSALRYEPIVWFMIIMATAIFNVIATHHN